MAAFLKTALFFLLAVTATARYEEDLAALQSQRHRLLAPLSDQNVDHEVARAKVEAEIDEILMIPSSHSYKGFWLELMGKSAGYPFEESEKNLNEEAVTNSITALIDSSFPDPNSISASGDQAITEYFKALPTIYAKIERLMKMELITQFMSGLNSEEKLKFRGEIIAKAEDQIISKANLLVKAKEIKPEATIKEVHERLSELKNSLMTVFLPRLTSLLDLFKNGFLYLKGELSNLLVLCQIDTSAPNKRIISKYQFLLESFGSIAIAEKKQESITALYKSFETYILATKRASFVGSIKFKELVPQIIGFYVKVVSTHVSPQKGYETAQTFLSHVITSTKSDPSQAFFREYINGELPNVSNPEADDFVKESLKAIAILNNVEYPGSDSGHKLLMWWLQANENFGAILESVSTELMEVAEVCKMVTSNVIHSYKEWPQYYFTLYDMLMGQVAEKGVHFGNEETWTANFLEYINQRLASDDFVRKYYLLIVAHVLYFREQDSGSIVIQDFKTNNAVNFDALVAFLTDKDKTLFFFKLATYLKEVAKIPLVRSTFPRLPFVDKLIGMTVPYSAFAKANTQKTSQEKAVMGTQEENIQKKKVGAEVSDGKANNKLSDIEKKAIVQPQKEEPVTLPQVQKEEPVNIVQPRKEEPIVIPQLQVEEKVVIPEPKEKTPVKEQPLKEKTPIKEKTPVKQTDDGVNPNKINVEPVEIREEPVIQPQIENPQNLKDIHEETTPLDKGTPIQISDSPIKVPVVELENLVDDVNKALDPVTLEALRKNPDLIDLVEKIHIVVDEVTGDETHYHYIQVVPKNSACYDSINE